MVVILLFDIIETDREAVIPEIIHIKKSKIFEFNDVLLIRTLCSILFKCSKIPHDNVRGYLHPNRLYQTGEKYSKDVKFSKLPEGLKFSYDFPPRKKARPFYFLDVYKRTGDGKVALWTCNEGIIGVSKFFIAENTDVCKEKAAFESERWRELWKVETFVELMFDTYVLFMPFVFHIRQYEDTLQFCPMHAWNYRLNRLGGKSSFFTDDNQDDQSLKKIKTNFFDEPLLVAETALRHMIVNCGWMQDDSEVRWEHFGLMPVKRKQNWTLVPIMFDLSRLRKISEKDKAEVYQKHVEILKNLIPKPKT